MLSGSPKRVGVAVSSGLYGECPWPGLEVVKGAFASGAHGGLANNNINCIECAPKMGKI